MDGVEIIIFLIFFSFVIWVIVSLVYARRMCKIMERKDNYEGSFWLFFILCFFMAFLGMIIGWVIATLAPDMRVHNELQELKNRLNSTRYGPQNVNGSAVGKEKVEDVTSLGNAYSPYGSKLNRSDDPYLNSLFKDDD